MNISEHIQEVNNKFPDVVPLLYSSILEEVTGDVTKEYEQRFELKEVPNGVGKPSEIKQALLFDKPGFSLRIRREKSKGNDPEYSITCKFYKKSDEAETFITSEMFDKLWPETIKATRMEKTRYRYGDWVVDDIRSPKDKVGVVAEIETETEDEDVELPKGFVKEVSEGRNLVKSAEGLLYRFVCGVEKRAVYYEGIREEL